MVAGSETVLCAGRMPGVAVPDACRRSRTHYGLCALSCEVGGELYCCIIGWFPGACRTTSGVFVRHREPNGVPWSECRFPGGRVYGRLVVSVFIEYYELIFVEPAIVFRYHEPDKFIGVCHFCIFRFLIEFGFVAFVIN